MMHDDNWWWNMPMMWIIWILLLIILIFVLTKVWNNGNVDKSKQAEKESPMDLLKRRYANGEMTTEEYEKRKKILEGS